MPTSPLKWWVCSCHEIKLDPRTHCSCHVVMNACEMSLTERATLELFERFSARLLLDWYLGVLHIVIWWGKIFNLFVCVSSCSHQSKYLCMIGQRRVSVLQGFKNHDDGTFWLLYLADSCIQSGWRSVSLSGFRIWDRLQAPRGQPVWSWSNLMRTIRTPTTNVWRRCPACPNHYETPANQWAGLRSLTNSLKEQSGILGDLSVAPNKTSMSPFYISVSTPDQQTTCRSDTVGAVGRWSWQASSFPQSPVFVLS